MLRLRRTLPVIAVAAATTMAIAACGSGSPSSSGNSSGGPGSGPTQAQVQRFQNDAIRFTDCMRAHGIAGFPDPPTQNSPSSGRTWKNAFANQSPGFMSAADACRHFMPGGGAQSQSAAYSQAQIKAMLAFARCIRAHGLVDFPDPTSSAGITHEMIAAAGINLHQPAVTQAADACVGVTHGFITRAMVARFVTGH
jgi:hypothetical protein